MPFLAAGAGCAPGLRHHRHPGADPLSQARPRPRRAITGWRAMGFRAWGRPVQSAAGCSDYRKRTSMSWPPVRWRIAGWRIAGRMSIVRIWSRPSTWLLSSRFRSLGLVWLGVMRPTIVVLRKRYCYSHLAATPTPQSASEARKVDIQEVDIREVHAYAEEASTEQWSAFGSSGATGYCWP